MQVAKTILEQLGGNKFIVMTGAKNFVGSDDSLSFRIGRNAASVNAVTITLLPSDTYRMDFYRIRKSQITQVKEFTDVYADQLQSLFTEATGLYTSL